MLASVETKRVKILDLLENVQFQPIQRLAVFAPVAAPSVVVDPGRFPETFSLHAIQQTITALCYAHACIFEEYCRLPAVVGFLHPAAGVLALHNKIRTQEGNACS
jgi:hypothetical protein